MKVLRNILFVTVIYSLFILDSSYAQVAAGFTVNYQTKNCNPATVSFTNTSTGIGTLLYEWNFGVNSGVNSILANPSVTYLACGTFNVVLKVINGLLEVDYDTIPVTIFCSPKVNFSSSPASGCIPLQVQFLDNSVPGTGLLSNYLWDFGDGNTGSGASPLHDYTISGCKNVTLIITDENNCTDDTTFNNLVCVNTKPTSSFTSSASISCSAPFTVNFTSNSTGKSPLSYEWRFNGGSPSSSTLQNPSVTYGGAGSFDVQLVVTDSAGCTNTIIKSNYASIAGSTASFAMSGSSGCAPLTINVSGISSSPPLSWKWTTTPPASPASADVQDVSFVFSTTGTYQLCLEITYSGNCIATKCTTVTVGSKPSAGFTVSGNVPACMPPLILNYTNTSPIGTGLSYKWFFPGGNPDSSTQQNPPLIIYSKCGSNDAMLTVSSGPSCADTFSMANVVNIDCPVASFNGFPISGCSPLLTQFITTGTSGSPTFWEWNFGDTSNPDSVQSNIQNPSHLFTDIGCYTIRLITGNAQGCIDTLVDSNLVCVGTPLTPDFAATPTVTCAINDVAFQNLTIGADSTTTFAWDFLDSPPFDVMSTEPSPFYHYPDTGWFSVTLAVCRYGCCDTLKIDSLIHILPPIAEMSVQRDCANPLSVIVHGENSQGADTYQWLASGGIINSPTDSVTTITFPSDGNYHVKLVVHNNQTGCDDTASIPVDILNLVADFYTTDTVVCSPKRVCFTNTSQNAISYQWRILNSAGTQIFSQMQMNPCRQFNNADSFDVILIATDVNGCMDTMRKNRYVTTFALNLSLAGNVTSGCVPLDVTFSTTAVSSTSFLVSYLWNFGDTVSRVLDTSTSANPTHTYFYPGLYDVTLFSTDDHGCQDSLRVPQYIHAFKPQISFTADTAICIGQQSCFTNSSIGTNLSYNWNFGDNLSSTQNNPCHLYTTEGDFTVTLIGTEPGGCADTLVKPMYIHVTNPHADFSPDSSTSSCPPLKVTFSNLSTGIDIKTKYEWLFGDGSNSNVKDPFHIYNQAGYFDVTLIITNQFGCTDTIVYDSLIHVSGASATYTVTPPSGCAPLNVCFIAHSGNAASYTWDFGNGNIQSNAPDSVCYQYSSQGIFHPTVILDDGAGCVYSFPIDSVIVGGPLVLWNPSSFILCDSGTVQFMDSSVSVIPIVSRKWSFGDGKSGVLDSSSLQNPSHHYDTTGVYVVTLIITTNNGCDGSFSDTIFVIPKPQVLISSPDSACRNSSVSFSDSVINSTTLTNWQWNFGDNSSGSANVSFLPNPQHAYQSPGIYTVTLIASSAGGCGDTATLVLTILDNPLIITSGNVTICKGLPTMLNASGANSYQWTPSAFLDNSSVANPICTPLANITYMVTGYNSFGCSGQANVVVDLYLPQQKSISPDAFICRGSTVQLNAGGGLAYSWVPVDGLSNSSIVNPVATPSVTTTYKAIIRDSVCLTSDTLSSIITVSQLPLADAGPDGTISAGESYPIQARASGTIEWSPIVTLNCSDCEDPVASPLKTTTYTLSTINADGCRNSDEVVVFVLCNGDMLYIPNVFSPNNNGKNDVFRIRTEGAIKLVVLRIYDRWGEEVFVTDNINEGWDGTYKGRLHPPAVYVFYLQAVCANGEEIRKQGNITLVR